MKVFLLDDHELFTKSLTIALSSFEIELDTYSNYSSLLETLHHNEPDIFLLDVHLKETNGFEVATSLLACDPNRRIIFLSGFEGSYHLNKAFEIGAKAYLNKDISVEVLIETIESVYLGEVFCFESGTVLSKREIAVLELVAEGLIQEEIAERLFISRRTVNNHIHTINNKLGVASSLSSVIKAIKDGIIVLK